MSTKHKPPTSHYHEAIARQPGRVAGLTRKPGGATDETKQIVIDAILKKANDYGLSDKDKANLIAIANIKSGFNPDAASTTSTASGVMQVIDQTADDMKKLSGSKIIGGHRLETYDRFDMNSNIEYGIATYLAKKHIAKSDDVGDIYTKYNPNPDKNKKYIKPLQDASKAFEKEIKDNKGRVKLETVYSQTNSPRPHAHPSTQQPRHPHHPATPAKHLSADPHRIQGVAPPAWSQPDALGIRSPMVCYDTHILEKLF